MRTQDLLGALFLYVIIAFGYGAWIATHDPRWLRLATTVNPSFLAHCLTWPRLLDDSVRSLASHRLVPTI